MVDDEDYPEVSKHNWSVEITPNTQYAVRFTLKKDSPDGKRKQVKMHQDIMKITDMELEPDHIDRNGLNNQRSNLRSGTSSQQKHNTRPRGGTSKYKGLSFHKSKNKWKVEIVLNYKRIFLGRFEPTRCGELLAALTYDIAAEKYHGDFAYLNFPKIKKDSHV